MVQCVAVLSTLTACDAAAVILSLTEYMFPHFQHACPERTFVHSLSRHVAKIGVRDIVVILGHLRLGYCRSYDCSWLQLASQRIGFLIREYPSFLAATEKCLPTMTSFG